MEAGTDDDSKFGELGSMKSSGPCTSPKLRVFAPKHELLPQKIISLFNIRGVQYIPRILLHTHLKANPQRFPTTTPPVAADAIDHLLSAEAGCLGGWLEQREASLETLDLGGMTSWTPKKTYHPNRQTSGRILEN